MSKMICRSFFAVLLLGSVLALGCTQQDADRPTTCPVTGTVTHNNQTVDGANVIFQLADGSRSAVGVTDAGGNYSLRTFEPGDGAVPGQYKVKIFKYETLESDDVASVDDENYVPPEESDVEAPAPKNLLPEKYADVNTSELTANVSESGENKFDFNLE